MILALLGINSILHMQSRKNMDTGDIYSSGSSSDDAGNYKPQHDATWAPPKVSQEVVTADKKDKGYGASWAMQYVTLFRRAIKVRRFEALSIQDLAQTVCVSVLGGTPSPPSSPFALSKSYNSTDQISSSDT